MNQFIADPAQKINDFQQRLKPQSARQSGPPTSNERVGKTKVASEKVPSILDTIAKAGGVSVAPPKPPVSKAPMSKIINITIPTSACFDRIDAEAAAMTSDSLQRPSITLTSEEKSILDANITALPAHLFPKAPADLFTSRQAVTPSPLRGNLLSVVTHYYSRYHRSDLTPASSAVYMSWLRAEASELATAIKAFARCLDYVDDRDRLSRLSLDELRLKRRIAETQKELQKFDDQVALHRKAIVARLQSLQPKPHDSLTPLATISGASLRQDADAIAEESADGNGTESVPSQGDVEEQGGLESAANDSQGGGC